jgi:hypothetical protein
LRDRRVGAVGGDEVDQRFLVLQVEPELEPVRVRLDRRVVVAAKNCVRAVVQRRDALAAAAAMLIAAEVERQTDEGVAHRVGDELVELVGDLVATGRARGCRPPGRRSA